MIIKKIFQKSESFRILNTLISKEHKKYTFMKGKKMNNGGNIYRRFFDGDRDAVIEIVSIYNDDLVLFVNGIVGDMDLAEEITEDVFLELLIKKPKYNGKSSFKTWLYAIARHKAYHNMQYMKRFVDKPFEELSDLCSNDNIEQNYTEKEQHQQLHKAMKLIKPQYAQVLYLTYFEGFSNTEAAKIMKKSNRQIENLIYRAKNALKKELEKEGFTYEEL